MAMLRAAFLACMSLVLAASSAPAQEANPKKRREPPVVSQPSGSPSTEEACARERREREKRRAQGLPVVPLSPTSPCRTSGTAEKKEPPPRKVDTPLRIPIQDPAGENRRRRIQQNTGGGEPPKLR